MSWPSEKFEKLGEFKNGVNFKASASGTGYPLINVKDVTDNHWLDESKLQLVEVKVSDAYFANKDDIFFVRSSVKRDGIGLVGKFKSVPEHAIHCGFVIRFRPDQEKINSDFLLYLLKSYTYREKLKNLSSGAAHINLSQGALKTLEIPIPALEEQKAVAQVIKKYDDLIENNKRRIELLEESARQLYKEWFVRFRFPGHEHVKIINGVPEGWQRLKISDLCTVGRGASPRPIQNYMDGEIPWFKIADATASESPFIFETKEKVIESGAQKSVYLPEGELILSNSATCGVPNFTGVKGCIHDGWLYFKGLKTVDKWFLYLYLVFQQRALLQGIGEGATQKNLNTTYVGNQIVTIPDSEALLQSLTDHVEPVFMQIKTLASYNRQLSKARDLLLPKLMNGEIAV